jgi:hypothetical protein
LDGRVSEKEEQFFDMYVQDFFLYCYSMLRKGRNQFQESKEGSTYTLTAHELVTSRTVLNFLETAEKAKFDTRVRKMGRSLKTEGTEELDTEFIEVDWLL